MRSDPSQDTFRAWENKGETGKSRHQNNSKRVRNLEENVCRKREEKYKIRSN